MEVEVGRSHGVESTVMVHELQGDHQVAVVVIVIRVTSGRPLRRKKLRNVCCFTKQELERILVP